MIHGTKRFPPPFASQRLAQHTQPDIIATSSLVSGSRLVLPHSAYGALYPACRCSRVHAYPLVQEGGAGAVLQVWTWIAL